MLCLSLQELTAAEEEQEEEDKEKQLQVSSIPFVCHAVTHSMLTHPLMLSTLDRITNTKP